MQHGIYYAYWEKKWEGDYIYYTDKAARLGFDILEIAASPLPNYTKEQILALRSCAKNNGIRLTAGHGPNPSQNIASADPAIRANAIEFYKKLFDVMGQLDINLIGGGIYSYWPVDYSQPIDKEGDWKRSVEGVREMADLAAQNNITLCLEVLNRFEGYILNTSEEGTKFVKEVDKPNVKVMLDTFHMNIEETSIGDAIRTAGSLLGHFHTGECNRLCPGKGRTPWREIHEALRDIGYDQACVMEPFVQTGGKVGSDIKVWREMVADQSEAQLDKDAQDALIFQRYMLG
jgi:D-psicose/D-tagatose/L-ribulose 3-epimerase